MGRLKISTINSVDYEGGGNRMTSIKEMLKSIPFAKSIYRKVIYFHPFRVRFRNNLKKVVEFDRVHGTDFSGRLYQNEIGTTKERANDYSPSPDDLIKMLKKRNLDGSDSIVDMGCGKGYAMYLMARHNFSKVGGVELSSQLCEIANNNLRKTIPQKKWQVYNCDAGSWNGYDEYNIFYIYNSFPKVVMEEVKNKISKSFDDKPREIEVWYLYPEFPEVFIDDFHYRLIYRDNRFHLRNGMWVFKNI